MIRIEGHYRLDKVLRGHYDALRDHYEVHREAILCSKLHRSYSGAIIMHLGTIVR